MQINENNADQDYGGEATLTTDMDDAGSRVHAMLRFDDIVGYGPGQIPPGATILSAKLVFNATSSTKGMVRMHRMLVPWGESSTWMDFTPAGADGQPAWAPLDYFNCDTGVYRWITLPAVMVGGGVEADGAEALAETDAAFTMPKPIPVPFVLQPGGYGTTCRPPAASVSAARLLCLRDRPEDRDPFRAPAGTDAHAILAAVKWCACASGGCWRHEHRHCPPQ